MFKCECGSTEFWAHQILKTDIVVDGMNEFVRNFNETDDSLSIYDHGTPYGPYVCLACGLEYDELINDNISKTELEEELYLKTPRMNYKYNPKYGDNRIGHCGRTYEKHFDPYENMEAEGYKYCKCHQFVERTEENKNYQNVCRLCGCDTLDKVAMICDKCADEFEF